MISSWGVLRDREGETEGKRLIERHQKRVRRKRVRERETDLEKQDRYNSMTMTGMQMCHETYF